MLPAAPLRGPADAATLLLHPAQKKNLLLLLLLRPFPEENFLLLLLLLLHPAPEARFLLLNFLLVSVHPKKFLRYTQRHPKPYSRFGGCLPRAPRLH